MTLQELVDEIGQQPSWEANGKRAPHKPLTLLFALGQAMQGNRMIRYEKAEPRLIQLLDRFGPPRGVQHPEQPVWRLRSFRGAPTSFWRLDGDLKGIEGAGGNPRLGLMRERVSFGLSESAWDVICGQAGSAYLIAVQLAEEIVPTTLQYSLLEAVGIDAPAELSLPAAAETTVASCPSLAVVFRQRVTSTRLLRDPAFSRKVLDAYETACAICAISPRLSSQRFGLEAAHIRWAQAGGPDEIPNGLCLCKMHHVALDYGALKIDETMRVRVSSRLDPSTESLEMFGRFEGREIRLPKRNSSHPNEEMLRWHATEVFKP